jgi:hypothetical protein
MNRIGIVFVLGILIFTLLNAGCMRASPGRDVIFTTYSHPNDGLSMKYPQTWDVNRTPIPPDPNTTLITFSGPGNQSTFRLCIQHYYYPPDEEGGGVGLGYDVPNATTIEFQKTIQISGRDATRWTFRVKGNDREYMDVLIAIQQKCPELQNNQIFYSINYDYTTGDARLENIFQSMVDSMELTCPSSG